MSKRPQHFKDYGWSTQRRIIREMKNQPSTCSDNSTTDDDESYRPLSQDEPVRSVNSPQNITDSEIDEWPGETFNDEILHVDDEMDDSDGDDAYNGSSDENPDIIDSDDDVYDDIDSTSTESETEDEDRHEGNRGNEPREHEPLYRGAAISTFDSLLAILTFILRHRLTGACIADLLELIAMHCLTPNYCVSSFYKLKKYFAGWQTPVRKHFYCLKCYSSLDNEGSLCRQCGRATDEGYFIEIPIISQLQSMFERSEFIEILNHRYTEVHPRHDDYRDIYDGAIYKELSSPNAILANANNISFTWYTDGISIFKSSKFNIWPLFLVINELPFNDRFKIENVLLAGLWFGSEKPVPNLFLQPLHAAMTSLYEGIRVSVLNVAKVVKGIILCGTCDLPAKSLFMNMNQYNGKYGCQKCLQPGQLIGRVRVYPYKEPLRLRTNVETRAHARQAHDTGSKVFGVKGPSVLTLITYKCIETTAVDVMHCVFGGVAKRLLELWFSQKFRESPFSLSRLVKVVDSRLCSIIPPAFVQRGPRSIENHLKFWKTSEFKNWFFYYSLAILSDLMEPEYFDHYQLLVLGVSLLCQPVISEHMINTAEQALRKFVSRFENLYGIRHMSCNLHHLLHLADVVRNTGPLWTLSCFPFEDLNGKLKVMVHGSKAPQLQIHFVVSLYNHIFTLTNEKQNPGTRAHAFCKRLLASKRQLKLRTISHSVFVVGSLKKLRTLPDQIQNADFYDVIVGANYYSFKKLFKDYILYTSEMYNGNKKSKSFCVKFTVNESSGIGFIQYFIRATDCDCTDCCQCRAMYYAVIKRCETVNIFRSTLPGGVLSHYHKVQYELPQLTLVDVHNLKCVCFVLQIEDLSMTYIVEPVNTKENE